MFLSKGCRWAIAAIALAAFVNGTSCKKAAKVDFFPPSGAVAGWQKTSATRVFAANDLWQYIDSDSEQYVKSGVVSAATSEYKYRDHLEAVVDVYTMGSTEGAHTILGNEQANGSRSVALGDEAIAFQQSVSFRKGHYLVHIVAYQLTPETEEALLALARGVEARLK
jgi:hypothetical protein